MEKDLYVALVALVEELTCAVKDWRWVQRGGLARWEASFRQGRDNPLDLPRQPWPRPGDQRPGNPEKARRP